MAGTVFVICAIGEPDSPERKRADTILDYILTPLASGFGLSVTRADRESKPGHVTTQILQSILDAAVVVADLTGQNPNVFYELAFAHSFGKPVVLLVDDLARLPFDTQHDRTVSVGNASSGILLEDGERAKETLRGVFQAVLAESYKPESLISTVAGIAALEDRQPENPVASQLADLKAAIADLPRQLAQFRPVLSPSSREERVALTRLLERLVAQSFVSDDELRGLITERTSRGFDAWVRALRARNPYVPPSDTGDIDPDDIPF